MLIEEIALQQLGRRRDQHLLTGMLGEWNGDGKVGQGLAHARPRFAKVYTTLLVTREAVEDVTNISLLL